MLKYDIPNFYLASAYGFVGEIDLLEHEPQEVIFPIILIREHTESSIALRVGKDYRDSTIHVKLPGMTQWLDSSSPYDQLVPMEDYLSHTDIVGGMFDKPAENEDGSITHFVTFGGKCTFDSHGYILVKIIPKT